MHLVDIFGHQKRVEPFVSCLLFPDFSAKRVRTHDLCKLRSVFALLLLRLSGSSEQVQFATDQVLIEALNRTAETSPFALIDRHQSVASIRVNTNRKV